MLPSCGNYRSAHDIRMTVEIFGRGMDNKIRAKEQRFLQNRREERVVYCD